jgi:predicted ribosome quality control (RQC) complex YloA/Tae2 family protein
MKALIALKLTIHTVLKELRDFRFYSDPVLSGRVVLIKKSMDIIDIYAWIYLYGEALTGCIIDNVYRAKYYWLIKLRCKSGDKLLKIEPSQRLHFSISEPSSKSIDKFTSYLRAHIRGGRITSISQPWWERVVVLETYRGNQTLRHYVELLPRGVWAVTSSDDKILYASRFMELKDRAIRVGVMYNPPPVKSPSPLVSTSEELMSALMTGKDLVRGVVSGWGLPGYIAEELLLRSGLYVDKNKKPNDISRSDLERLIGEYRGLIRESLRGQAYLIRHENTYELYTAFKPRLFEELYDRELVLVDLNSAIDAYFSSLESHLEIEEKRRELEEALRAQMKRIEEQAENIEKLRKEYEDVCGVLRAIYENYDYVHKILDCVLQARKTSGWEAVKECGSLRVDRSRGLVCLNLLSREICLSVRKSLNEQVIELEKRKGELASKIERAEEVLEEMKKSSFKIEEELKARIYSKPAPRFWYEKYRWTITRRGFLVIAGRDASQNEVIVKRYLGESDIFLHADIHGAPATVLLRGSRELTEADIFEAAVIAACYSRAWREGLSYVDVYWVYGRQVSKSPPSGEYLSKGAFMIYGPRNYLRVPLVLGIGLKLYCDQVYGEYVKVIAGNPDTVKETSLSYVYVVPGEVSIESAKREIARRLVENAYRKTGVLYSNIEEVLKSVIPGPLRVVESGTGMGVEKCEL